MLRHPNQPSEYAHRELLSSVQVKAWFRENGISVVDWAIENRFSPALVYAVMNGKRKCLRGESHQIAVALGMKRELPQSNKH